MTENPQTYNLLQEHWIPVLWANGKPGRVGIREVLTQAGRIRQIAASNPMDRVAILRFLLALLYWCRGSPPDNRDAIVADSFPAHWFSKLDEHRDCFNLLGEGKRLYQDPRARRSRPATDLLQEIPTGNNFWHLRHSTDAKDGLCPPCCAMGLLRLPLFSVSGLPDLKSGINGKPPVYVVPWGASLFETLRANWTTHPDLGEPAWLKPNMTPTPGERVPLLTGLTLLSRRVWLHDRVEHAGACIACGAREAPLILTCENQSAGSQQNELWDDPHVVYLDAKPRKPSRAPDLTASGKFRMDRPWPNMVARIAETGRFAADKPKSLLIVGFASDQAKNIDVWERTILAPSTPSEHGTTAPLIRRWDEEGRGLSKQAAGIVRSRLYRTVAVASIRPHVEGKVSARVGELLTGRYDAWDQAAREYRPMMAAIARSLSPGFTASALGRRQQIARVAPDMQPKTEAAKKPRRKKGGNK